MSIKINNTKKDYIVKLYTESNLRIIDISNILNVSTASIQKTLVERGITLRRGAKLKEIDIDRAVTMYEQGYYLEEIFDTTGIHCALLYQELDKRDIPRRRVRSTRTSISKENTHTKDIIVLYQEGKTLAEISRELSMSQSAVKKIVDIELKNGTITLRPCDIAKKKEKERIDDIAKLYTFFFGGGKITIRQIANYMNVDAKKLYRAIREKK